MKKFLRKYIWLFLMVALLLLFPQSMSTQAALNMRMIISGIAIDCADGQYELTAQVVLPSKSQEQSGINAKIDFVSAKGKTIGEAIVGVSSKFGKVAEMSHLEYIMIGQGFENKNIAGELDYFFRNFKLKNSFMLIASNSVPAKETIQKIGKLDMGVALSMQKIFITYQENSNAVAKTYVDFISETFSESGISVVDTLDFEKEESSEQQPNSQSQEQSQVPQIMLLSPIKICKNGQLVGEIADKNHVLAYYFCCKCAKSGNFQFDEFSYGEVNNAKINIRLDNYCCSHSVDFGGTYPLHKIKINISEAHIDEIASDGLNKKIYTPFLDKDLQQAIIERAKNEIKQKIYSLFDWAKENNIDIFNTATIAFRTNPNKWKNFVKSLENKQDYLAVCDLDVEVNFDMIR